MQARKMAVPWAKEERHITTRTVQKIVEKMCKKAGIKKGATVHSLRRSFATPISLKIESI